MNITRRQLMKWFPAVVPVAAALPFVAKAAEKTASEVRLDTIDRLSHRQDVCRYATDMYLTDTDGWIWGSAGEEISQGDLVYIGDNKKFYKATWATKVDGIWKGVKCP